MPSPSLTRSDHKVVVGIAELAVSNNPSAVLTTYSLGSCLGIAIYDPVARVGGLLHLMLPDSAIDSSKAATQPAMFVDTGVPALLRAASDLKADKERILIYVAGGAKILDGADFFNIGQRNFEALGSLLDKCGLRIQASQIGGSVNRTLCLSLRSGEVSLKVSGQSKDTPLC